MNAGVLELLIESYRVIGTYAPTHEQRVYAFARMAELVARRSPERIERMELERGLRAP